MVKTKLPPTSASLNTQLKVLETVVKRFKMNQKPVFYKDLGGIQVHKAIVSNILSFYGKIGWLKREKYRYSPTDELLGFFLKPDPETYKKKLAEKLKEYDICKEITFTIQETKIDEKELFKIVGSKDRFGLEQKDRKSFSKLVELMNHLDIISIDPNNTLSVKGEEISVQNETTQNLGIEAKQKSKSREIPVSSHTILIIAGEKKFKREIKSEIDWKLVRLFVKSLRAKWERENVKIIEP